MAEQPKIDESHETERIKREMEDTRASLAEKLEVLEDKLGHTVETTTNVVESATKAVEATVESVKETVSEVTSSVQETVSSVASTFNLRLQTERRPWMMFGLSVGTGTALGLIVGRQRRHRPAPPPMPSSRVRHARNGNGAAHRKEAAEQRFAAEPPPQKASWLGDQLQSLKGLALATTMAAVRDLVERVVPGQIGSRIAAEVDSLTQKLGAEPIRGPVFPVESETQRRETAGAGTEFGSEAHRFQGGDSGLH